MNYTISEITEMLSKLSPNYGESGCQILKTDLDFIKVAHKICKQLLKDLEITNRQLDAKCDSERLHYTDGYIHGQKELKQIKKVAAQWQSAALELSAKLKELQSKNLLNIPKVK